MYDYKVHTIKIDLNSSKDLQRYDEILNDPTCKIIREIQEKITQKSFDEEGKIAGIVEELIRVVTYQRRSTLEI